ncbi:cytochrome c3 family protein [Novosphingobium tardum]|uniref:Cytochrome c3 family protein n=1 Tax=Novosphingobium tardum TaxID=1538021 RepID=A0ABV8RJY3_9SPHN
MSFLVRQIALKANGDEIVRARRVDGDEMTIGRDPTCGVQLPDLAVELKSAVVTQLDETHLMVESLTDHPFEVDGKKVMRSELDVTRGPELAFGGHRIVLSQDPRSRFPTFTVRRLSTVANSAKERETGGLYTLAGLVPGKRMSAWAIALVVLAAFLAWPIYSYATYEPLALHKNQMRPAGFHPDKMWESGKLSLAHQGLENDCQACHVEKFVAVRDNACLTCHQEDAHQHIADRPGMPAVERLTMARGEPRGFAGFQRAVATTFNKPAGRCVECHTEHEGAGAMPPTQQRFCTDCHDGLKSRLPDTKIPDAADFGTAHPQFMPAVIVDSAGAKPLVQRTLLTANTREFSGIKFTHAQHLSTTNGIAQMVHRRPQEFPGQSGLECQNCHQKDPTGTWFKPVVMEESCQTCHSLTFDQIGGTFRTLRHGEPAMVVADLRAFFRSGAPVRPINLNGMARRRPGDAAQAGTAADYARAVRFYPVRADQAIAQVFSKGGACYDCHTVTAGPASTGGFAIKNVAQTLRYYKKGWFTHDKHTKFECADCHVKAETSNDSTELLVPGIDGKGGCRTCHVGEGGAHLASVQQPVKSGCAMCHDYHADDGAPWMSRQPASRRAAADGPRTVSDRSATRVSLR